MKAIAVLTDFSETSREPFPAAAALAKAFGAHLRLVHVAQPPPIYTSWQVGFETASQASERIEQARAELQGLASHEPAFCGLEVEPCVIPESQDVFQALSRDVDLIVIASHGHSKVRRFALGSFTAKVLQSAGCPVLVFHVIEGVSRKVPLELRMGRILVPHDFSGPSVRAVAAARAWAGAFGATVRLLFVAEPRAFAASDARGLPAGAKDYYERIRSEGLERLRRVIRDEWGGIEVDAVARCGRPADEILEEEKAFGADLIIMASRGLSLIERIQVGSVADKTIHGARSPVLVVKEPRFLPRYALIEGRASRAVAAASGLQSTS